jgi:hypothetical protein
MNFTYPDDNWQGWVHDLMSYVVYFYKIESNPNYIYLKLQDI